MFNKNINVWNGLVTIFEHFILFRFTKNTLNWYLKQFGLVNVVFLFHKFFKQIKFGKTIVLVFYHQIVNSFETKRLALEKRTKPWSSILGLIAFLLTNHLKFASRCGWVGEGGWRVLFLPLELGSITENPSSQFLNTALFLNHQIVSQIKFYSKIVPQNILLLHSKINKMILICFEILHTPYMLSAYP